MIFKLPELPYPTNALEPHIDQRTMEIHHGRHHAAYVKKLNQALEQEPGLEDKRLPELLANNCGIVPERIRVNVRNNGGGHANHELFWALMSPTPQTKAQGRLAQAIAETFGNLEQFRQEFSEAGMGQFGSGWAWLVLTMDGRLVITSSPNQHNPLMWNASPVLGLDVWEHAYYLKYQNRRADYIRAWWKVVDWAAVEERYEAVDAMRLSPSRVLSTGYGR
jgi:Fe-Mn family superoxide dismutase